MFSLGRIMSLCCGGGVRVMTRGGTSWCVMVVVEGDGGGRGLYQCWIQRRTNNDSRTSRPFSFQS